MKRQRPLFFVACSLFCHQALSANALNYTIHQQFISTRAIGMGNAYTAAVDDSAALFYNPAALSRRQDGNLHLMVRGAVDKDFFTFYNEVNSGIKQPTQDQKISSLGQLIENNFGHNYYARVPTLGGLWVRPHWGMALIPADIEVNLGIHQQAGPMLDIVAYGDTTLAFGYGHDIDVGKTQQLSIGTTVKVLHRLEINQTLSVGDLALNSKLIDTSQAQEGLTVDADIGVLYSPPIAEHGFFHMFQYFKPTFAFVTRNVVNEGFFEDFHFISKNSKKPEKLGRTFDVGTVWDLPTFWKFSPRLAADMRDMGNDEWTFRKGLHIGAELGWKMYNWWKGNWSVGLNQGYWTASFGARIACFRLDLTTYGEDVGAPSQPVQSRRYMVEASLDF